VNAKQTFVPVKFSDQSKAKNNMRYDKLPNERRRNLVGCWYGFIDISKITERVFSSAYMGQMGGKISICRDRYKNSICFV
jgi:hypothetical protein